MTEPIDFAPGVRNHEPEAEERNETPPTPAARVYSNPVHERVGDRILRAAQEGVRRGVRPEDIIREIAAEHKVRLNISDLRLLLATRRPPEKANKSE